VGAFSVSAVFDVGCSAAFASEHWGFRSVPDDTRDIVRRFIGAAEGSFDSSIGGTYKVLLIIGLSIAKSSSSW